MSSKPTSVSLSSKVSEAARLLIGIPDFVKSLGNHVGERLFVEGDDAQTRAEAYIWDRLAKLGLFNDEDSEELLAAPECTEGDARHVFCENGEPNLPVVRFKRLWFLMKSGCEAAEVAQEGVSGIASIAANLKAGLDSMKPLGQWTDAELMAKYGFDCDDSIIEELSRRSKGRPFVMFTNETEGTVDVEASLRLLKEGRKRETPVQYKMGDILRRLFCAGDFPSQVFYECPIHKGVLLLDGYCDECGHTWEGVSYKVRQFVRVITNNGEAPESSPSIRQLIATARSCFKDELDPLALDYPKSFGVFRGLEDEDKLPSLKSRTASSSAPSKSADPFGSRRF
jgi:hypothetical protein